MFGWIFRSRRPPAEAPSEASETSPVDLPDLPLEPETIAYLGAVAEEAFKRQADLDDSIWRSLPFFAATLALAATIIGAAARDTPVPAGNIYTMLVNAVLALAVISFGIALIWLWVVVRPRRFIYPASPEPIRGYARQLTEYYAGFGLVSATLDARVKNELGLFMIDQYGKAADSHRVHNGVRLKARSQTMFFILLGFALAILCETAIYVAWKLSDPPAGQEATHDDRTTDCIARYANPHRQAGAAPAARGRAGCVSVGPERQATDHWRPVMPDDTRSPTPAPAPSPPVPPAPDVLLKHQHPPKPPPEPAPDL